MTLLKITFGALLVTAGLIWFYPASAATSQCAPSVAAKAQLAKRHHERVVSRGLADLGKGMIELLVSPNGSWTILGTNTEGLSCIVAAGDSWHDVPSKVVEPGEGS